MVEQIRKISLVLLDMVDLIVRLNVTNNVALSLYKKFLYPFLEKKIKTTPEKLIRENLQITFDKLMPYFEKKQLSDMVDEAEKLGSPKVKDLLKSEYF